MLAVIFAGGKSSRMKRDKSKLPFGKYSTLIEYQYKKLYKIFDKVYISSKNSDYSFCKNIILDMDINMYSPLIALHSTLISLEQDTFILSVDTPFINELIIKELYKNNIENYDAIIAKTVNGIEPLCGIYKSSTLDKIKELISKNQHSLKYLLSKLRVKYVNFNKKYFLNLNYQEDYEKALRIILSNN